ncbi:LysR family transcriptional regulator [Hwanghaeella sp.]|uniref:LysR family transcriptional regulator n=1 Tax=Hwanghaeella sp. TaxID=2605943 RepID=UPI003CCC0DA0
MDRLQTMSVFVAVAEEGGFAPAARRLSISPPSVTRAISELEIRLGCRLFHRTTRSVHLTEAGERYLGDCRRILAEVEEADRHAAGIHAEPRGTVSVTGSAMFGSIVMTPILLDLLDRYPDLSVSTLFVDRIVHVVDEGIDVAVRIADLPDSSLTAIRVGAVRRVLCASPSYLAKRGRPQHPADLDAHDVIHFTSMAPAREWVFEKDGRQTRYRPSSRFHVNTAAAAINGAEHGRGITRVLSYMIAPQLKAGGLEILMPDYEPPVVPVHVVHKEAGHTSARVRAVIDHLVQHLRRHPVLANE